MKENPYWPMANGNVRQVLGLGESELLEKGKGGNAFWLAWGLTSPHSQVRGDEEVRRKLLQVWDAIADRLSKSQESGPRSDGDFWNQLQLLESLLFLKEEKEISQGKQAVWKEALLPSVEKTWSEYGHKTETDWATSAAGDYPNADAQHAAVMMAASLVYGDEKYRENAEKFVQAMDKYLLPPGAWLYFRGSTPIPLYHGFEIIFLGRYYQLSKDPLAADQIRRTRDYYPSTFAPENTVEGSSTPVWKDGWNPHGGPYHAVEMVAWLAGDGYNRWFADMRSSQSARHYWVVYCGEAWDAAAEGRAEPEPFPDAFIIPDESISGLRGRFGKFSFVGGLGKRITSFGGAMLTDAGMPSGYDGYVHLARLGISVPGMDLNPMGGSIRMFGEDKDGPISGTRLIEENYAVLAGRFEPRTAEEPEAPAKEDWLVTERWFFSKDGIVAAFEAVAQKDDPDGFPEGVILCGPAKRPFSMEGKSFMIGNLHGRLLQTEGFDISFSSPAEEAKKGLEAFHAIRLKADAVSEKVRKGSCWKYAVVFSPVKDVSAEVEFQADGRLAIGLAGKKYKIDSL